MKKIVDLEKRWKIYKYRMIVFYIFIAIFVAFVIVLGIFIKSKFSDDERHESTKSTQTTAPNIATNATPTTYPSVANQSANIPQTTANLICRQITTERLNVRAQANFSSVSLGYYERNGIFCADSSAPNGMLHTPNGWVSGNGAYSRVVNLRTPTDNGFVRQQGGQTQARIQSQRHITQADIEEVRVFDKPNRASSTNNSARARAPQRPLITSQSMSKEKLIEFKEADFKNTRDYDTAIDIARFYFDAKNYDKSAKWAYDASNVDSHKQKTESFIIYAKSLYLSGKKDQAFDVLTNYISNTNSSEAIEVLNKMREGNI